MKLYNSLTSSVSIIDKNELNIYSCGPTVYNYIHIGNARPLLLLDILVRYLTSVGKKVNFLQNITDIDDKIINMAIEQGVSEKDISKKYFDAFMLDLKSLNINMPTKVIPISEKMDSMIEFIADLISTNDAYEVDGDVYFDIKKWSTKYGELSGRETDQLIVGERINIDNKKRNPLDFVIWKKTKIGKKWESPFGKGRPGWHTECAVLINDYFNEQTIDIHAGGVDLKFPHHENERIQYWAHNNCEIANTWMHNGHLTVVNEKMSKSLGNVILVKDFVKDYSGNFLRWIFMTTNYKQPININDDLIGQGNKFFDKLDNLRKKIIQQIAVGDISIELIDLKTSDIINQFNQFMDDDLNTSRVLSLIEQLIKDLNTQINNLQLGELIFILDTLGFENAFDIVLSNENKKLIHKWKQSLSDKNFVQADELRNQLKEKGLI